MPFLETVFGKLLLTFGTAMVPVLELRGTAFFGPKIVWLERRAHLKGRLVRKYRLIGLVVLVGIPLPGTGAWTGALVASVLDIRMRSALPAILVGLVIAAAVTLTVTMGLIHLF